MNNDKKKIDVIILGGSFAGCFAALSAAKAGARVVLLEPGTYLGYEITATMRPWVSKPADKINRVLNNVLFTEAQVKDLISGSGAIKEIPLQPGHIKRALLRQLTEAGVTVLFMTYPAGVLVSENKVRGVIAATKSGLQSILGKALIDASGDDLALRLVDPDYRKEKCRTTAYRTVEYREAGEDIPGQIVLPEVSGFEGVKARIHAGTEGKGHCYVEYELGVFDEPIGYEEYNRLDVQSRKVITGLSEFIKKEYKALSQAVLMQVSHELYFSAVDKSIGREVSGQHKKPSKKDNIFTIGIIDFSRELSEDLLHAAITCGKQAAKYAAELNSRQQPPEAAQILACFGRRSTSLKQLNPRISYDKRFSLEYISVDIPQEECFGRVAECKILIIGGGTSGAPAAIAAGTYSDGVVLAENMPGLGGTGTLGGINVYWHGCKRGYTEILDSRINEMTQKISRLSEVKHWNIEARMAVYQEEALKNNVSINYRTIAAGVHQQNGFIKAVAAADRYGLKLIKAGVIIDATGDGDIAAWAGCSYITGDPSGGNLQTFNHCDWKYDGELLGFNVDLGVADWSDFLDLNRAIYTGHFCSQGYDLASYPSTRECRHIDGDYRLTPCDVFNKVTFSDTIAYGSTDFDQHGLQGSDFARLGYMHYHLDRKSVRFPYRCSIPKGIENLLVAGKAFSAEKDAFSFMRMQPDLQNMGYALGVAAAFSREKGNRTRDVDIAGVQEILLNKGIIVKEDIEVKEELQNTEYLIGQMLEGSPEVFLKVICNDDANVAGKLLEAYRNTTGTARLYAAMALAWFGKTEGLVEILDKLEYLYTQDNKDETSQSGITRGGFAGRPNAYWLENQLIVLLGKAGDEKAVDLLSRIVEITCAGGPPLEHPRVHWRRIPNYDRIVSLCYAFERLTSPKAVKPFEKLLQKPYIGGYITLDTLDMEGRYAGAYLELLIARTLAACGGKKGLMLLADYLGDVHTVLSNYAYMELKRFTGEDFGKDSKRWREWIEIKFC